MGSAGDSQLLQRWRDGDTRAGNALFRRHFSPMRRFFANKVAAEHVEELVQRTFTGCVESADRFRGEASFRTFLFSIARRQLYKHFRDEASRRRHREPDLSVSSVRALGQSPSSLAAAHEAGQRLVTALQSVPVEQQIVLELFYWEQLPTPEIAQVLEVSPTTVRTRLHRARVALKEALQGSGTRPRETDPLDEVALTERMQALRELAAGPPASAEG